MATHALPPQRGNELSTHRDTHLVQRLASPLSLAAYVTWLAITAAAVDMPALRAGAPTEWAGLATLAGMLALFVLRAVRDPLADCRGAAWNTVAQGVLVVAAEWFLREGQTAVLLIIVAGQMVLLMPVWRAVAWLALFNLAFVAIWLSGDATLLQVASWWLPVAAFQAFAGLTGHYAGMSERQREHLSEVNAELLATRHLLEESARGGERLKLSRELHDVAGHKLTALKLNLALLERDAALADRPELATSRGLADDLLADIRGVVSELRMHDGLELRGALEALARPVPGTDIRVDVPPDLRVADLAQAEALVRCAQEATTNALRHGRAARIDIHVRRDADALLLQVDNDGVAPRHLRPGNGLSGMRERIEALGGTLEVAPTPPRGVRVLARLPGSTA